LSGVLPLNYVPLFVGRVESNHCFPDRIATVPRKLVNGSCPLTSILSYSEAGSATNGVHHVARNDLKDGGIGVILMRSSHGQTYRIARTIYPATTVPEARFRMVIRHYGRYPTVLFALTTKRQPPPEV
jgi:hypothetical protein